MSNAEWNADQAAGERSLRQAHDRDAKDKSDLAALRLLVAEMWADADAWHGEAASSHYRSRIAERARAELQGQLRFDRALKRYQLEDLKLSGEASGEPFQGKTLTFATQGQLLLDQAAQIAEWNGLKLSANQLRALGELKLRNLDKQPALEGGLSIAQFNLREFLDGIGQPVPAMSDSSALGSVELVSRLQGSANSLTLQELTLKLDESTFTGNLSVSDFAKQAVRAQLKGDRLNLDRYLPAANKEGASARQNEVKNTLAAAGQAGTTDLPQAPSQQAWS